MEVEFKNYGIKFDLPEGVIYYNKDDVLDMMKFDSIKKKSCFMVLGEKGLKTFAILSFLGTVESPQEFKNILNDSIKENIKAGLNLLSQDTLLSQDGRKLFLQTYEIKNIYTITIYSNIDSKMILCSCSSDKGNFEKTQAFALKIMQGLFKAN